MVSDRCPLGNLFISFLVTVSSSELPTFEHRKLWCLQTLYWLHGERSLSIGLLVIFQGGLDRLSPLWIRACKSQILWRKSMHVSLKIHKDCNASCSGSLFHSSKQPENSIYISKTIMSWLLEKLICLTIPTLCLMLNKFHEIIKNNSDFSLYFKLVIYTCDFHSSNCKKHISIPLFWLPLKKCS